MSLYQAHIETVKQRFDEALTATGYDSVLIFAGQPSVAFLDDNNYPFRVNPFFKYWVPITESPKSYIFYRIGQTPRLCLFQARDFWHAQPELPPGEWRDALDLTLIDSEQAARTALHTEFSKTAFIGEPFPTLNDWGALTINPEPLINHLHYQRGVKTAYEVDCMRKANLIAARGHNAARDAFYDKKSEFEIHLAYQQATRANETELPYHNIVGLNQHGAVLHYDRADREAPGTHLSFLIDAGAYYNGYCADITRTYSGSKNNFFAELVEAMDRAEQQIIAEIEIGRPYYELHVEMHRKTAALLKEFGLMKVDAETCYKRGYSNAFFPHGLGHFIGLQVHDVGGFLKNPQGDALARDPRHPFLRLHRTVEAGQVFTIEPGLYVIDQLLEEFDGNEDFNWQRIGELRDFGGVRIEDSVHVTNSGIENITRDAFTSLA
ncbi:MAG: Xaa-Pro dipeptidase [Idiomarinaceae bacterium HL-53]|nr:MAG: Xaa-Pro dipeptidase [Idiomarinaceae bacterium HL-53]CUS48256.1 Xaa-Pro dipeptidase [Idiomarinaceae bacterium HL-53]